MRAKPIFTYSLLAGALAFPGHALALGLGKLTVDSALGQPLSARIELTSVTKEDLDSLRARVADPNLYRQNNLTYQQTLSRARITLEGGGGTPFLRVTSPVSVQEPFLDLLVELDWASGRVVREYTFLLDPPGLPAAAATEPVTPARAGTPARTGPAPAARAPAPSAAPAASAASATSASGGGTAAGSAGGEQYTVKRGDTLQRIASQYKPTEATLEQMLSALFRGNPAAFEGDNMNRLRAGAIMNIPPAAEVQATPAPEAARVVRMQAADWRTYRDRVAGAAPTAAGGGARESSGRIGAAVEDRTPAAPPGSDQLRVSRAATAKSGVPAEDAIAREQQLKDAQARIAALEKTIAEMQRAVELRNQTLAQLQAQADAARGKAAPAPNDASASSPTAPAPSATAPAVTSPAPATPPPATPTPTPAATDTKAAASSPAPAPAPAKAAAPKAEPPGFFTDLFSSVPNWAIGAGALVILGGIAAMIAARRRKGTKFEDSIISGTDIKTNTVFGSTGGGVVNTGDNSLASDFSREGLGNIDTDEVDPIAEAEVYLAYGRDAQAEEILKDALKKDPQRQEIYLKLLEIHSQHNKPQAFETVASELFAVSKGQGDVWHKAVTLGRQLDPSNPMFQDGAVATPRETAAPASTTGPATSSPPRSPLHAMPAFNDGDISVTPAQSPAQKSAADILAGAQDAVARSAAPVAAAVSAAQNGARAGAKEAIAASAAGPEASSMTASPFAQSVNDLSTRVDTPAEPPRFDLDFQLEELDHPAPAKPAAQPKPEPSMATSHSPFGHPAGALELDKLDLSFDPARPALDDPTPSVLDGQWHDAATKLDLAKAYQEMGDTDGAREILQEVLHEGDDQQKSEAQGLLAKLAS